MLIDWYKFKIEFLLADSEALIDNDVEIGHWMLEDSYQLLKGNFFGPGVHFGNYIRQMVLFSIRMLMNFWMALFISTGGTSYPQIGGCKAVIIIFREV